MDINNETISTQLEAYQMVFIKALICINNCITYLPTPPNLYQLYENSIKIINRYSSWLDFTRLNEGLQINMLNISLEFEDIINNSYSIVNQQLLKELNTLQECLTFNINYRHIWNKKINNTQTNEHNAIAKYASNYIAHNSFHKILFGNKNKNNNNNKKVEWKQISEMIEQLQFIRDWKLYHSNEIIQKQINILQSLTVQHRTNKNNLSANHNVWKRHTNVFQY